jgi:hypothetical protein
VDDETFGTLVAVTRHFEDTGLIWHETVSATDREWQVINEAKLTVSEHVDTSRMYLSARLPTLCRAVYRATGKPRSGQELDYVLSYARDNHIRSVPVPVWLKR